MSFEANCNCAVQNKKRKEGLIPFLTGRGEVEQRRLAPIIADSNYFVNTSATLFHRRPREKLAFQRSRRNRVDCGIEERVERRIPAIHSRARKKKKKEKGKKRSPLARRSSKLYLEDLPSPVQTKFKKLGIVDLFLQQVD